MSQSIERNYPETLQHRNRIISIDTLQSFDYVKTSIYLN